MRKAISLFALASLIINASKSQTLQEVTTNGNTTSHNVQMTALSLYGQSLGFNRDITNGYIFNNSRHAYQFQHSPSLVPGDDNFALQVYRPDGSNVTPYGLVINGDGNVGIGTAFPACKLDISGALRSHRLNIFNTNISAGAISGDKLSFNSNSDGSGFDLLVLDRNLGYLGIGTTSPAHKLDVNGDASIRGTLKTRKIKVTQTDWADYVFDSSYQLPSLTHVETFIQENKHLPEVPSAAEIKNDGLDLGDNQATLLKKIEELTLYIIQQNKELIEVKKRLAEVEAKQAN